MALRVYLQGSNLIRNKLFLATTTDREESLPREISFECPQLLTQSSFPHSSDTQQTALSKVHEALQVRALISL